LKFRIANACFGAVEYCRWFTGIQTPKQAELPHHANLAIDPARFMPDL